MKTLKVLAVASSVASGFFLATATYAQNASSYLDNLTSVGVKGDLMTLIYSIINWAIGIAALVCVVVLIVSGYKYITAAGDENKVTSATQTLTFAIIGLVICFIAVILVQFVLKSILKVS